VGLGTLEDAEAIKPLKVLSFADATASGLGRGGADSSAWACVLARVVAFTCMGAESGCFVPGSESAAMIAAIRVTGESPTPADGLLGGAAGAILGAKLCIAELARPGVLVEGAVSGEDMGATAGAGCPESWGALAGCVLDLLSFP
jgi:hypothetical protein